MAEMGNTSSMTSVTEEEISSESDTTESSINLTSSLLSSTDTDDKLTPKLTNIKISKSAKHAVSSTVLGNSPKRRKFCSAVDHNDELSNTYLNEKKCCQHISSEDITHFLPRSESTGFVFPYGTNPLPLSTIDKKNVNSSLKELPHKPDRIVTGFYAYADLNKNKSNDESLEKRHKRSNSTSSNESACHSSKHSYFPDWTSVNWYKAKCFDNYWRHYHFAMRWYNQHFNVTQTLHTQLALNIQQNNGFHPHLQSRNGSYRAKYQRNNGKWKQKIRTEYSRSNSRDSISDSSDKNYTSFYNDCNENTEEEEEDEIEMEVTDEMAQFIETSLKHKMERENLKKIAAKENDKDNLDKGPTTSAPTERPGARRAAELKELYGAGAAMIHGMETALQMTYDRDLDRFKPKLWPNMPLKMIFS